MSDYGDISDTDLLALVSEIVEPQRTKSQPAKAQPQRQAKKEWLPREEWIKLQPWYKEKGKKERAPRAPRKRKVDEYDPDLSEHENEKKFIKHRSHVKRRREKASPPPKPFWEANPVAPREPGQRRQRARLKPFVEDPKDSEDQRARRLRVRRRERSRTPEWLEVPDTDRHKYSRLTHLDGRYMALKEDTLFVHEWEMSSDEDGEEFVDMGKLFGFMA